MKKYIFLTILFPFIIGACKSDQTDGGDTPSTEELIEEIMAPPEDTSNLVKVEPIDQSDMEIKLKKIEIDPEEQKKQVEQKKKILTEQIDKSPNKGKSCDKILEEYEKLVNEYIAATDKDAVIDKFIEWSNDPIYNNCKKKKEYKARFDQLEEKMYADEDS